MLIFFIFYIHLLVNNIVAKEICIFSFEISAFTTVSSCSRAKLKNNKNSFIIKQCFPI